MTHAEPAPIPAQPATINGQPLPTVLADTIERLIAAAFGTWPPPTPETSPIPQPAIEEA